MLLMNITGETIDLQITKFLSPEYWTLLQKLPLNTVLALGISSW